MKASQYIGVYYCETNSGWGARRWSKNDKKPVYNGFYKSEETAAHASDTLARKFMKNGEQNHKLNFPDDDTEVYAKKIETSSKYIGVTYNAKNLTWRTYRRSRKENKMIFNGNYKDEETAAHASDTLARKLMANGEQNHKLNFPYNDTEVYPQKTNTSKYIGVSYDEKNSRWSAYRWCKNEKRNVYNGYYKDEKTAAHASDTLARKLIANGGHKLKLNFPEDDTEEKPTASQYIGVTCIQSTWVAYRWSKNEKKKVYNGCYKDEETAAHASDILARKLMANGEQNHKLNFPDDDTEVYAETIRKNKRKRPNDSDASQTNENFEKFE